MQIIKQSLVSWGLLVLAVALVTTPVHAGMMDYTTGSGLGINIPDDSYDGSLVSMTSSTIVIGDIGTLDGLTVEVAIDHTWVGDLVFKLEGSTVH